MTLTPNGNVGIGTTSPETPLHIEKAGSSTGQVLKISNTESGVSCRLELECNSLNATTDTNPPQQWSIEVHPNNGNMNFYKRAGTGTTGDKMTITGDGKVGINTNNPVNNLNGVMELLFSVMKRDIHIKIALLTIIVINIRRKPRPIHKIR